MNGEKKWASVATDIGYNPLNSAKIGALLKSHYERILYPLDVFEKEEASKVREDKEMKAKVTISVAEQDPSDPYVFGPPGSGSGSISQKYGSGSFYHQAKIVRKTLIPTALCLLFDFLSLKNYGNVPSKSNKQKNF